MTRFPVIVGPTAGGKSDLAVEVALALGNAEIVTADAFQVYRGMDIGTAKPAVAERRGVVHHLIDVVEPTEPFSVSQWLTLAEEAIRAIRSRGATPVVVGGTHLYVKALLDGLFEGPDPDPELRRQLRAMDPLSRRAELARVDPGAAARIHANDERRTIRALEVFRQTGQPITTLQSQWNQSGRTDCVLVGLSWPTAELNKRINARVKSLMDAGLIDEVRGLFEADRLGPQAREALGYKQVLRYLKGEWTIEEATEATKIETRRFAKNQRTWLRRLATTPGSKWIDAAATPCETWAQLVLAPCVAPA